MKYNRTATPSVSYIFIFRRIWYERSKIVPRGEICPPICKNRTYEIGSGKFKHFYLSLALFCFQGNARWNVDKCFGAVIDPEIRILHNSALRRYYRLTVLNDVKWIREMNDVSTLLYRTDCQMFLVLLMFHMKQGALQWVPLQKHWSNRCKLWKV